MLWYLLLFSSRLCLLSSSPGWLEAPTALFSAFELCVCVEYSQVLLGLLITALVCCSLAVHVVVDIWVNFMQLSSVIEQHLIGIWGLSCGCFVTNFQNVIGRSDRLCVRHAFVFSCSSKEFVSWCGVGCLTYEVLGSTSSWVAIKWLPLGWVTDAVCSQVSHLRIQPTPRSTQPSIPLGYVNQA